jgi:hypothetical protein
LKKKQYANQSYDLHVVILSDLARENSPLPALQQILVLKITVTPEVTQAILRTFGTQTTDARNRLSTVARTLRNPG